jgi:transcription elongation factor GreA
VPEAQHEQLTRAQYDKLAEELAELEGPRRKAVVEAIATARAHGDLSENFEYHAAKNEQGLLERRITILRSRLQHAAVRTARRCRSSCRPSAASPRSRRSVGR